MRGFRETVQTSNGVCASRYDAFHVMMLLSQTLMFNLSRRENVNPVCESRNYSKSPWQTKIKNTPKVKRDNIALARVIPT
jgi:hypothetical protein